MEATRAVLEEVQAFRAAVEETEYAKAVEIMTRLIARDPKRAPFFASRAKANVLLGRMDEALKDSTQALQRDGKLALAHLCKGCALVGLGRHTGNAAQLKSGGRALQQARTLDKTIATQDLFKRFEAALSDQMARNFVVKGAVHQNDFGLRILDESEGPEAGGTQAAKSKLYNASPLSSGLDEDTLLWIMCDALLVYVALDPSRVGGKKPGLTLDTCALLRDRRSLEDCRRLVGSLVEAIDVEAFQHGARNSLTGLNRCVRSALSARVLQVCMRSLLAIISPNALVKTYEQYVANVQRVIFALLGEGDTALSLRRGGVAALAQRLVCSCLRAAAPTQIVVLLRLRIEIAKQTPVDDATLIAEMDEVLAPFFNVEALSSCEDLDLGRNWTAAPPWLVTATHGHSEPHVDALLTRGQDTMARATASAASNDENTTTANGGLEDDIEAAFAYSQVIDVETGYGPWNLVPSCLPSPLTLQSTCESSAPSNKTCECAREPFRNTRVVKLAEAWEALQNSDQRERIRLFSLQDLQAITQHLRGEIPGKPMDVLQVAREIYIDGESPRAPASYKLFALAHEHNDHDATAENDTLHRALADTLEVYSRLDYGEIASSTAGHFERPLRYGVSASKLDVLIKSDAGCRWQRLAAAFAETKLKMRALQASPAFAAAALSELDEIDVAEPPVQTVGALDERIIPNCALPPSLCVLADMAQGYPMFGASSSSSNGLLVEETYYVHACGWRQKANAAGGEAPGSLVFSDGWVVTKRCASACFASVGLVPIYLGEAPLCCECGQGCASTCALDFSCGVGGGSNGSGSSNGRMPAWLPELKLKSTLFPDGKRRLSCYVANFAPDITNKQRPARRKKRGTATNGKASTVVSEAATKSKAKENGQVQSIPSTTESALSGQKARNVVACAQPSQGRRGKRPPALQCNACGGDVDSNRCSGETRSATETERTNDSIHSLFERILRLSQTGPALADELQHEVQCCKDLAQQYTARRDDVFSKGERLFNLQNILTYLEEIDAMHSKTSDLAKRHVQGRRGHSRSHDPPAQTSAKDLSAHSHFASCVKTLCETMSKVEQIPRSLLEVTMDSPMLSMRLQASLEACLKPSAPTKQVTGASVMIDHADAEPSSGSPLAGGAGVLSAVMSLATSAGRAAREDARAEASALHEASVKEGALLAFCADFLGPLSRVSEEICVAAAVNPYEGLLATPRKSGDEKMSMEREKEGEEGEIADASVDKQGDPEITERWDDWRQEIASKLREPLEMHEVQTIAWKQEQFFAGRPGLELGQQEARRIAKTAGVFYPTPRMALDLDLSEREAILDLVLAAAQVLVAVRQVQVAGKEAAANAPLSDARMDDEEVTTKVQAIFKDQLVLVNNTVHLDAALSQQVQQNFTCEDDLCHVRELIISAQHRLRALKRDYEASLENLGAVERALRRNVTMRFQFFTAAIAQLLVNRVEEIAHQSAVNAKHRATLLNQVEPASLALGAGGGGATKTRKSKSKRKTRSGKSVSEQEGAPQEIRSYSSNDTLGMTENGIGKSKDKEEQQQQQQEAGTSSVLQDMKTLEQDVYHDDPPPCTQGPFLEKDELSVDDCPESWTTVSVRRKGNRHAKSDKTQHTDASADREARDTEGKQFQTQAKEKMEFCRENGKSTKGVRDRATAQVIGDVEKESVPLHSSHAAALTKDGRSKDDASKQKSSDVAQSPESEIASKSSQKTSLADRGNGDVQANGSTSQPLCLTEKGTRGDAVTQAPPDSNSSETGAVSPATAETSTKNDEKINNRKKKKNRKKSSKSKKPEAVSQNGVDKAAVDVLQNGVDKPTVNVSQNGVDKAAVDTSRNGVDKPTVAALDAETARESSTLSASSTEETFEHAPAPVPAPAPAQKSGVPALSSSEKAHEPTGTSETAAGAKGNGPPVVDICRLFLQGNCPEGDACLRRHVTPVQLHDEMLAWAQGQTIASERLSVAGQGESEASGAANSNVEVGQTPPIQNVVAPEQPQPGTQFVQVGQHVGPPGNFWPPYLQAYMQNGMMPFAPSFHPPHPPPPQPMMHVPLGPMPGPSGHEMYYPTPYMMPGYPSPPPPFLPMPPQHPYYLHAMPPHATMMPMQESHQHVGQQDKVQRDENEPTSAQERSEAEG